MGKEADSPVDCEKSPKKGVEGAVTTKDSGLDIFTHETKITRHRPATNGIAERFVERLKEMLAEREWKNVEELVMVLEEVIPAYKNDVR